MDAIDQYLKVYREVKSLEAELKVANAEKTKAKEALLQYLSESGLSSAGRGNVSLTVSQTAYSTVQDFTALRQWVYSLGEPISEYMEEMFRRRPLNDLVREAIEKSTKTGKVALPPGLGHYISTRITVRERKAKNSLGTTASEMLTDALEEA